MRAWHADDLAGAANGFREAQRLLPHAATAFNLARVEERAEHPEAAIEAYEEYLRLAPGAPNADAVRASIERLRASLPPPVVAPVVVTPPVVTPPVVTPPVVTPPVVTPPTRPDPSPPTSYDRITERRRRLASFRVGLIGGFAAPRDRQNLAVGLEATVFLGRSITLLGHGLFIEAEGAPKVFTGELGWTFVGDDFDLAVLAHAGALLECVDPEPCTRTFLGGLTLKVDVLFHPRVSVGLYGRFSWRDLNLLDGDSLLSSIGLSVSFHL